MKKFAIIFCLLTLTFTIMQAQDSTKLIYMEKVFGGYNFYKSDTEEKLKMKQLVYTMRLNTQAFQQIQAARGNLILANIISNVGGFMIGWSIAGALTGNGGKSDLTIGGIGAGLIFVSIPINRNGIKQAKQAVNTYNDGIKSSSNR